MVPAIKTEYFRLKVNDGNSYYSIFRDHSFDGLWIGWSQEQLETVKNKKKNNQKLSSNDRELLNIVDCLESDTDIRKIIFIWDREKQEIAFWEINGQKLISVNSTMLGASKEKLLASTKTKKLKGQVEKSFDHISHGSIIPCVLLGSFSRSRFPAFVDSLSVYFYLNIGTFRPLKNIAQNNRPDLSLFKYAAEDSEFSMLVGYYFNWMLLRNKDPSTESFADYYGIVKDRLVQMSLTYMSPAQLETFGSLLLIDLGLTLEIGIGKSLNDIDLRATYEHKNSHEEVFNSIIAKLKNKLGVALSEVFLNHLRNDKTIFVQCKDYKSGNQISGFLYLAQSDVGKEDCINLNAIAEIGLENLRSDFPLVTDWIERSVAFYC